MTVLVRCTGINLDRETIKMQVDDVEKLTASLQPIGCTGTISWSSTNPEVASVFEGDIFALAEGVTTIIATTENGIEAKCEVIVEDDLKKMRSVESNKAVIKSIKNLKGKKIKISLKGINISDGFEVQYSTKKNFASRKSVKKASNTVNIKKLKKGKTYYVRARVYKKYKGKIYYGKWSDKKKIKISK